MFLICVWKCKRKIVPSARRGGALKSRDLTTRDNTTRVDNCPGSRCQSPQFWWSRDVRSRVFSRPARSSHSERAVTKWWRGTWHCDRARRGESEACSGGRCGRRRDKVGQITGWNRITVHFCVPFSYTKIRSPNPQPLYLYSSSARGQGALHL